MSPFLTPQFGKKPAEVGKPSPGDGCVCGRAPVRRPGGDPELREEGEGVWGGSKQATDVQTDSTLGQVVSTGAIFWQLCSVPTDIAADLTNKTPVSSLKVPTCYQFPPPKDAAALASLCFPCPLCIFKTRLTNSLA